MVVFTDRVCKEVAGVGLSIRLLAENPCYHFRDFDNQHLMTLTHLLPLQRQFAAGTIGNPDILFTSVKTGT